MPDPTPTPRPGESLTPWIVLMLVGLVACYVAGTRLHRALVKPGRAGTGEATPCPDCSDLPGEHVDGHKPGCPDGPRPVRAGRPSPAASATVDVTPEAA